MVSKETRRLVRQRARYLCEYCHSPEYLSPDRFTIDHIMPQFLGGSDQADNLALACHRCNAPYVYFTSVASAFPPVPVVGIALNTSHSDESQATDAIAQTEAETSLLCTDAIRFDAGKLLDAVMHG